VTSVYKTTALSVLFHNPDVVTTHSSTLFHAEFIYSYSECAS